MDRSLLEYRPEIDVFERPVTPLDHEQGAAAVEEMQHAAELLDRVDDGQLEDYLAELIECAGGPPDSPVRSALTSILGRAARRVVPRTGAPSIAAGRIFGLELEGLSPEDQAFQVARHFVRFAAEAARRASRVDGTNSPHDLANRAVRSAARTLAPGLLPAPAGGGPQPAAPPRGDRGRQLTLKELAMHDIDHTQEYGSEMSGFEADRFEYEGEWATEGGVLSEADEYELASELLGVTNEGELDQFLGGLLKRVTQAAGKHLRSPIGQAVGGVLKGVAKKALPLGGALDSLGPLGAKIGSGLASASNDTPGVAGETLAQEDQEFEGAKQFVRLAANTVNKAAAAPAAAEPRAVAQSAAVAAARQLAPGLLKKAVGANVPEGAGRGHSGRWARRGNIIVLYGV
jgi:hypothetical protein